MLEPVRACAVGDNTVDRYTGSSHGVFAGGNALNVAVHLSRLGADAAYFGAIAEDDDGRLLMGALRATGVDTGSIRILEGSTATTVVHVDDEGERTFPREEYGVSLLYQPTERDLEDISRRDIVHIGMLSSSISVRRGLFGKVQLLSQDCAVTEGFDYLDVAFLSAPPDPRRAESAAREAVAMGARLAVATCGAAGSIAFDGYSVEYVPAQEIDVVDSTGAGDSYIAAFLIARARGCSVRESMGQGTAAASATCTHVGAWL